jgi:hypothetical protein
MYGGVLAVLCLAHLHCTPRLVIHGEELLFAIATITLLLIEFQIASAVRVDPAGPTCETAARVTAARDSSRGRTEFVDAHQTV